MVVFFTNYLSNVIVWGMSWVWWCGGVAFHHFCLAQPHLFFVYKVYTTYCSVLLRTLVLSFVVIFLYTN